MNIHHLELFYYVARYGGVSEAVRNIPYGIQQPAVSSQVIQLEQSLGTSLFCRRPFALTPAGEKLYEFIRPFFDNLDRIAGELREGVAQHLSIGASEIVLRDYLPTVLQILRQRFPKLTLNLREGYHPELMAWLEKREVDLAITLLESRTPPGLHTLPLVEFPLVLLVPKRRALRSAADLWTLDSIQDPLICLPAAEPISKMFQQELVRRKVEWFPSIVVSSLDLIERYVASGYGIGVGLLLPDTPRSKQVRAVALDDFPAVRVGAYWHGRLSPLLEQFLDLVKVRAAEI